MEQKQRTIFYSWQSDDAVTKNYLYKCLNRVVKNIKNDSIIDGDIVLDESTKNKMGAVDIPATIMEKIDKCDVFVADLSFIGEYNNRKLVNQNVIYELGYMIGKHTDNRVVMLFNTDSGKIKDLPFDISHRRVMPFSITKDEKGQQLEQNLTSLLTAYLQNAELLEKIPEKKEIDLDAEERDIVRLYSTIEKDKRIIVTRTMGGFLIRVVDNHDEDLFNSLIDTQGENKFVANLDDLAAKGIIKKFLSQKGTPNYELTKLGYDIIANL